MCKRRFPSLTRVGGGNTAGGAAPLTLVATKKKSTVSAGKSDTLNPATQSLAQFGTNHILRPRRGLGLRLTYTELVPAYFHLLPVFKLGVNTLD